MKVFIGWLMGLATAWAALAIWQRFEFPNIDYEGEDSQSWSPPREVGPDDFENDAFNLRRRLWLTGINGL